MLSCILGTLLTMEGLINQLGGSELKVGLVPIAQSKLLFDSVDYLLSASAGETSSSRARINCLYVINPFLKIFRIIYNHMQCKYRLSGIQNGNRSNPRERER